MAVSALEDTSRHKLDLQILGSMLVLVVGENPKRIVHLLQKPPLTNEWSGSNLRVCGPWQTCQNVGCKANEGELSWWPARGSGRHAASASTAGAPTPGVSTGENYICSMEFSPP
ncbi:hypothetical protein AC1031_005499 [Aphanomyces cochlioides]|nr:hypothetical protein AC1031_005499 [Aphanomyces cochlioides]